MDEAYPRVLGPWWDVRNHDDMIDELEWTPVRSDIPEEKED